MLNISHDRIGAKGFLDSQVDLFCLSCRALGRNIGESIINYFENDSLTNIIRNGDIYGN